MTERMKPKQYSSLAIDTVELAKANLTTEQQIGICKFQIWKYSMRSKGQDIEDSGKIEFYNNWLKELYVESVEPSEFGLMVEEQVNQEAYNAASTIRIR